MTRLIGVDAASELVAGFGGHRVLAFTRIPRNNGSDAYYWIGRCGAKGFSPEAPSLAAFRESLCPSCFPILAEGAAA